MSRSLLLGEPTYRPEIRRPRFMSDNSDFREQLRERLLDAATRRRAGRIRRARGVVVVLLAATLLTVAGTQFHAQTGQADVLTIEHRSDEVLVTLSDLQAKPDEIRHELHDAGLDATVYDIPASPSFVGRFVRAQDPGNIRIVDPASSSFRSFAVRNDDLDQPIELTYGRRAHEGETYEIYADVFDQGEPLHCTDIDRLPVQQAAAALADRGFSVTWKRYVTSGVVDTTPDEVANFRIVSVQHSAENELLAFVMAPDDQRIQRAPHDDDCSERPVGPSSAPKVP